MLLKTSLDKNIIQILLLATVLLLTLSCSATHTTDKRTDEQWGIAITRLHLSANGYMVDFRYRVLDPAKAKELFVRKNKPYLIDQQSGQVLTVPNIGKIGPLRTSNTPKQGKIYWMFFENIARIIQQGSRVSIVIGEFRADNLVVL